jgi:hypothetical protein
LQNSFQKSRFTCFEKADQSAFPVQLFHILFEPDNENGSDAEKFLDEMTKVYRYLLKGDNEQLVTLQKN